MNSRRIAGLITGIIAFCSIFAVAPMEIGATEIPTEAQIEEKNQLTSLIKDKTKDSLIYSQLDMAKGYVYRAEIFYDDDGTAMETVVENDYQAYGTDTYWVEIDKDLIQMYMSAELAPSNEINFFSSDDSADNEEITVDANGNYRLVQRTEMSAEEAGYYEDIWPCEAGDIMIADVTIEPTTLEMKQLDFSIEHTRTGATDYIARGILRHGESAKVPSILNSLMKFDKHKVTINLSNGTVREFEVPVNAVPKFALDEGTALYLDAACTTPYEEAVAPLTGDLTVYCK